MNSVQAAPTGYGFRSTPPPREPGAALAAIMNFSLAYHWLFLASAALLALWGASLLAVRLWTRHQVIQDLLRQEGDPEAVRHHPAGLPAPKTGRPWRSSAVTAATTCSNGCRAPLISFKAINEMSLELIKEIARAYYPDDDRPELKASLADLVALHNRVGARLAAWLDTMPMRPFKDVELATVVRYHEMYQSLKNHWGYAFIKRHHLDKAVRWGWTAINYANPWYWGRKAAYHGGKEVAARLLMARIADLVGEEAVRLYGRRQPPAAKRKARAAKAEPAMVSSGSHP